MGWNLYRVWSTEWVRNPGAEGEALLSFLRSVVGKDGKVRHAMKNSNKAGWEREHAHRDNGA